MIVKCLSRLQGEHSIVVVDDCNCVVSYYQPTVRIGSSPLKINVKA